jgi:two-component system sensor histidine kinase PilS (NtrC family)
MGPAKDMERPAGGGLYRRLVWLTLLRIVLVSLLLAFSAVALLRQPREELDLKEQLLYGVILATYVASLVYLLMLRGSTSLHRPLAWVQIVGDVVIAAVLISMTGGAESVIVFMFPLTVVTAAVLLYRRGAMVAAVSSSLALLVVLAFNGGLADLPDSWPTPPAVPFARLAFFGSANVAAIFLTAALASYLAEQLRSARLSLTARETEYLALERLHESIVRSIPSGIITADRFGRVTFLNRSAEQITGLSGSCAGEPLVRLMPALEGRLAPGTPLDRFEADHLLPEGERRRLGFTVSPLLDREGQNHGYVLAFQDLTQIRAMESAMARSERLAAVGTMAAGLAHELRNPLASMSGSVQMLVGNKAFDDDDRRLMGIVLREADRLNALVSEFLQFARPSPAQLEPIDLRQVVDSTLALFANDPTRSGIQVRTELAESLPVIGDLGQLGQVLWNLLGNAADAMPEGGEIRVVARRRGEQVELAVSDHGPGISPDDLPRIFDPFFTTKELGTGLGLAIVHAIVQAHHGEVLVHSETGRGATLSVRLPARPAAEAAG